MPDEFYTQPGLAKRYVEETVQRWPDRDVLFVEPSAGEGSFVRPLLGLSRKVRAMDVNPRYGKTVKKGDFLKPHMLFKGDHAAIVVIGNPPFGKNASTAVQFFNVAADFADAIAFIVPRTFRKISLQKRLHPFFHLTHDEDVPFNSFIKENKPHDVPCAWQIWERKGNVRQVKKVPDISHLMKYTTREKANFAMRRVGFYAGRIRTEDILSLSIPSHYFLHEKTSGVIKTLEKIDWQDIVTQTAGVRSLSKTEIAHKLGDVYRLV